MVDTHNARPSVKWVFVGESEAMGWMSGELKTRKRP